ncbi:hypothetical protein J3F83DRAFT_724903 [Trichoderma novae-zelandiae]
MTAQTLGQTAEPNQTLQGLRRKRGVVFDVSTRSSCCLNLASISDINRSLGPGLVVIVWCPPSRPTSTSRTKRPVSQLAYQPYPYTRRFQPFADPEIYIPPSHADNMAQRLIACYQWIKTAGGKGTSLYTKISNRGAPYKKVVGEPKLAQNQDLYNDNVPLLD